MRIPGALGTLLAVSLPCIAGSAGQPVVPTGRLASVYVFAVKGNMEGFRAMTVPVALAYDIPSIRTTIADALGLDGSVVSFVSAHHVAERGGYSRLTTRQDAFQLRLCELRANGEGRPLYSGSVPLEGATVLVPFGAANGLYVLAFKEVPDVPSNRREESPPSDARALVSDVVAAIEAGGYGPRLSEQFGRCPP